MSRSTTLTRDELLVILCEEAAEVVQAATKCQRFGFTTVGPDDYGRNDHHLARELGQLMALAFALNLPNTPAFLLGLREKIDKAEAAKRQYAPRRAP